MKNLGITQRVEFISNYSERRDSLDQNLLNLASELNFHPIPLPNLRTKNISSYLDAIKLDAVILSGGNTIAKINPTANDSAPERDNFETLLLNYTLANNIPVVGICRGMQMINFHLGGKLKKIKGHAGVNHSLKCIKKKYDLPQKVNSFHDWTIAQHDLAKILKPLAYDNEKNIEAFVCEEKKILGIMWHPEREIPLNTLDIKLINKFIT